MINLSRSWLFRFTRRRWRSTFFPPLTLLPWQGMGTVCPEEEDPQGSSFNTCLFASLFVFYEWHEDLYWSTFLVNPVNVTLQEGPNTHLSVTVDFGQQRREGRKRTYLGSGLRRNTGIYQVFLPIPGTMPMVFAYYTPLILTITWTSLTFGEL